MAHAAQLSRYRPAVLSVAAIAAACAIYTVYTVYGSKRATSSSSLRRSNAVHRPRRDHSTVALERQPASHDAPLGLLILRKGEDAHIIDLAKTTFPNDDNLRRMYQPPPSEEVRRKVGVAAVEMILVACFNAVGHLDAWDQVAAAGFEGLVEAMAARDTEQVMQRGRRIPQTPHLTALTEQQVLLALDKFLRSDKWNAIARTGNAPEPPETEDMEATDAASKEPSHGLRGLLYYIAEEDAKRKAYEHRGIRCEQCGEMPIRGLRYHCLNCPDYDLCATCEQTNEHINTHVFAKIRVPLPVLSQPTKEYRLWYPGDPWQRQDPIEPALKTRLCEEHGYEESQVDALYDQFICNANVRLNDSKTSVKIAIDRTAFNRAMTRETWFKGFAANAMYDRMFAFYDTDGNGFIDFAEFVSGIAYLRGPKRFATLARAIQGYDLEGNGLVTRADFVRLLRAKYEVQKQIVSDMVEGREVQETYDAMETLRSSQPISSAFGQEDIPPGESRPRRGKREDAAGDLRPLEGVRTVLEDDHPWPAHSSNARQLSGHTVSRFEELLNRSFDGTDMSHARMEQLDGMPAFRDDDQEDQDDPNELAFHEQSEGDLEEENEVQPHVADIIWQAVEDGLHEVLDKIFRATEEAEDESQKEIDQTSSTRTKFRREIESVKAEEQKLLEGMAAAATAASRDPLMQTAMSSGLVPHNGPRPRQDGRQLLRRQMMPTDRESLERREQEISEASLGELLDSSGFGVRGTGSSSTSILPRAAHFGASSIWDGSQRGQATSPLRTVTSTDEEEVIDPTLPQHRPNAVPAPVLSFSNKNGAPPALPVRPPTKEALVHWAHLDTLEKQLLERGGPGRLTYTEIETIAVADTSGQIRGLVKSWLEFASF